jgi:hypothetical protein
MPNPSLKLNPTTDGVLRRMLATPPQPKVSVKESASKKHVKGAK